MTAKFVPIGEPAHDAERQALRFLVDNLPDEYVVYGNPWLVEQSGAVFELDAVVIAPHAVYVVEIKSYRGSISGNDSDWYVPQPIRSPLKLNRKTAQVLASLLKKRSVDAARPFIEGLVFLSHASDCRIVGPASVDRIHTRRTILTALQDPSALWRREGRRPPVDEHSARTVHELLTGVSASHKPPAASSFARNGKAGGSRRPDGPLHRVLRHPPHHRPARGPPHLRRTDARGGGHPEARRGPLPLGGPSPPPNRRASPRPFPQTLPSSTRRGCTAVSSPSPGSRSGSWD